MDPSSPDTTAAHLLGEVPEPVLFNTWKHHAGALRQRIGESAARGDAALQELAGRVVVLGTELMDLYTGPLTPTEIAARVIDDLRSANRLEREAYRAWVEQSGGYAVIAFAEDGSRWVLRPGDEGSRHIHVHPGRWSLATRRVRANVLRTAVMVLAWVGVHGGDPLDVAVINRVRRDYLDLSPVGQLTDNQGLHAVIELLRHAPGEPGALATGGAASPSVADAPSSPRI